MVIVEVAGVKEDGRIHILMEDIVGSGRNPVAK